MYKQQTLNLAGTRPANGSFNLLKVIAMLGLPFVHILEMYQLAGVLDDRFGTFENVICALTVFGPSLFMICMGLGLSCTTSPKRLRKTGMQMLIINFLLNLVRFFIPVLFLTVIGMQSLQNLLGTLLHSDIFYFVGFFYILLSYLQEAKLSSEKIFGITLLMLMVDIVFSSFIYWEIPLFTSLLGNFISVSYDSYFPLFGWSIYPAIGMLIEEKVFHLPVKQRNVVFASLFASGIVLFSVIYFALSFNGSSIVAALSEFALSSVYDLAHFGLILSITLLTVSLFYFLYQCIGGNPVDRFLISLSPFVFPYYLLQWIGTSLATYYALIVSLILTGEFFSVSLLLYIVLSSSVVLICTLITCKCGFTFSRWIFHISDYTGWFRHIRVRRKVS